MPEGLLTIVARALAVNIIKMSKQNALVKKMVACETIIASTWISLGQNRHIDPEPYDRDRGVQRAGPRLEKPGADQGNRMLLENFCVNGTADVTFLAPPKPRAGAMPEFIGKPTECALLAAAHKGRTRPPDSPRARRCPTRNPFSSGDKEHDHCGARWRRHYQCC